MAMKLEKENVRIIFMSILDDCDLYGREGKEAEHLLDYWMPLPEPPEH